MNGPGAIQDYVLAADRENTVRSYANAIKHFETTWKGLLPATSDSVARYLAEHATTLSISTLRQRLAALSRWHADHGFPDPTRSALVQRVFKGVRVKHATAQKRASVRLAIGGTSHGRQARPQDRGAAPHARPFVVVARLLASISRR